MTRVFPSVVVVTEDVVPALLAAGADDVTAATDEEDEDDVESPEVPEVLHAASPSVRKAAAIAGYFIVKDEGIKEMRV